MKHRNLDRGDVLPASLLDALQEFVGTATTNLRLTATAANVITATAGTGSQQSSIGIDGLFRYRTTNHTATVSGSAGVKDIYVTASANEFSNTPEPDTDLTDYNWYLSVLATGSTPSGNTPAGNPIVAHRKIGELDWDGAAITALRQTVGLEDATGIVKTDDVRLTNARTPTAHTHPISDVTSLQTTLDAKVATSDPRLSDARTPLAHTHAISDVTGLQTALDALAPPTRGVASIATEETRTNTNYGLMPTADRITGLVLPADGVIEVSYRALMRSTISSAGFACLFLNSTPIYSLTGDDADAASSGTAYSAIQTISTGLTNVGSPILVTTGQAIGSPLLIEAAAGTYEISVRYRATSGSVLAKDRKLRAQVKTY